MLGAGHVEVDGDEVHVVGERAGSERKYELVGEGGDEFRFAFDGERACGLEVEEQFGAVCAHPDGDEGGQDWPALSSVRLLVGPRGSP